MKRKWIRIPAVIALVAAGTFVLSEVTMLLWNKILPGVLHVGVITFWQAAGILVLCKILFGGFKGRRGMHGWHHRKHMMRKWQAMTPEERETFKARMCGCRGFAAE